MPLEKLIHASPHAGPRSGGAFRPRAPSHYPYSGGGTTRWRSAPVSGDVMDAGGSERLLSSKNAVEILVQGRLKRRTRLVIPLPSIPKADSKRQHCSYLAGNHSPLCLATCNNFFEVQQTRAWPLGNRDGARATRTGRGARDDDRSARAATEWLRQSASRMADVFLKRRQRVLAERAVRWR